MPTVDWPNKIINVSKAEMVLIQSNPTEIRQLDLDVFRLALKDLEDDEGMVWPDTHSHNTTVQVGGAILARVVQIINGYTVTFEDGQYAVNLVGANSNVGDVVNVNQVSVRSSNSAGLQDLNSLQAASFNGAVSIDVNSTYTGTVFPVGTRQFPVNNTDDLKQIMVNRGIRNVNIMSSMTLGSGTDFGPLAATFVGDNTTAVTLTIDPSAGVQNCEFIHLTVQGTIDGNNVFRDCALLDILYNNGYIHRCTLNGTITLGGGLKSTIMDCYSGFPGGGPSDIPIIDMGGSGNELALRGYDGGIKLINGTGGADSHSLDIDSGRVVLDSTITAGNYTIRGIADVEDNTTGSTVVDNQTVNFDLDTVKIDTTRARKLLSNRQELVDTGPDVRIRTYDDDGTTTLEENIVTDPSNAKPNLGAGTVTKRGVSQ